MSMNQLTIEMALAMLANAPKRKKHKKSMKFTGSKKKAREQNRRSR